VFGGTRKGEVQLKRRGNFIGKNLKEKGKKANGQYQRGAKNRFCKRFMLETCSGGTFKETQRKEKGAFNLPAGRHKITHRIETVYKGRSSY